MKVINTRSIKKLIVMALLLSNVSAYSEPIMYFCTASDHKCFNYLLNLIGSLFRINYDDVREIAVFDLGLHKDQREFIEKIDKVRVCEIEMTHPDLLKPVFTLPNQAKSVPGWYAWKPVMLKQALDMYPYVLLIDAGATIMQPLNNLFRHIIQNKYFFVDSDCTIDWMSTKHVRKKFNLDSPERRDIGRRYGLGAGLIGMKRDPFLYENFVMPVYEMTKDLTNFIDDGSTPDGFGCGRHDQPLFSIIAHLLKLNIFMKPNIPLTVDGKRINAHIIFRPSYGRDENCLINQSRNNIPHLEYFKTFIRYKKKVENTSTQL